MHVFDVILAPSAEIDGDVLVCGIREALTCAYPILEEPCYVFEIYGFQMEKKT